MATRVKVRRKDTINVAMTTDVAREGEIWVNRPDRKAGFYGLDGVPVELTLIRLFSTLSYYAVGDLVAFSGDIYQCTTIHSATAWNAAHFALVNRTYVAVAGSAPSSPITGQLWFDSTSAKLNVWNGTVWLAAMPFRSTVGAAAHSTPIAGDHWYDTTALILKIYDGAVWKSCALVTAVVASTAPSTPATGLLWYDTTGGVLALKVWNGSAWVAATVAGGGGATVTVATTAPVGPAAGALWLHTTTHLLSTWDGTAWVSFLDATGKTVVTATTALSTLAVRKLAGVTPEEYGAVGDGIADDNTAIKAWLTDQLISKVGGRVPGKIYRVTEDLRGWFPIIHNGGQIVKAGAEISYVRVPPPVLAYLPNLGLLPTAYSRANIAYKPNADANNTVTAVAADTRRSDTRGVLIEGALTPITGSALGFPSWTLVNVTAANVQGRDPTATDAGELARTGSTTTQGAYRQITPTLAQPVTIYLAVRASANSSQMGVEVRDNTAGNTTLAAGYRVLEGPGSVTNSSGRLLVTGLSTTVWTYIMLTTTVNVVIGNLTRLMLFVDGAASVTSGKSSIVWGAFMAHSDMPFVQFGAVSGIYSKNADVEANDITGQDTSYGSMAGIVTLGYSGGANARVLHGLSDASNTKGLRVELAADFSSIKLISRNASADGVVATQALTGWAKGDRRAWKASWDAAGRLAIGVDNTPMTVQAGATIPSGLTKERIGSVNDTLQSHCWHEAAYRWAGQLSDNLLASLQG